MGLDWLPGSKPKAGFESEFERLWPLVSIQFPDEANEERYEQISLTAWDALASQRIGVDHGATDWALSLLYPEKGRGQTGAQFVANLEGRRVGEVGHPGKVHEDFSDDLKLGYFGFRGGLLKHCGAVISKDLIAAAWEPKRTPETFFYGEELLAAARSVAQHEGIESDGLVGPQRPHTIAGSLHTVLAAARWCRFWSSLGHWLEVSY